MIEIGIWKNTELSWFDRARGSNSKLPIQFQGINLPHRSPLPNLDKSRFEDPHIHKSYIHIIIPRSKQNIRMQYTAISKPKDWNFLSPPSPLSPSLPPSFLWHSKHIEGAGKSTKMRNLEKVGWAGWCPRRGRNAAKVNTGRVCTRADRVCGVSQGWRVWLAHARMWASIRDPAHATLSLSFCHTHAFLRSSTCTHTRVHARARARAQVCRGDIGARTCSQNEKKNTRGFTRRKTSGFTARINSGSSEATARKFASRAPASPPLWFW